MAVAVALVAVVFAVMSASAHRRDEYLQAARLGVEPGQVELELDLSPGIAVAESTIEDLDRDRDGVLSDGEQRAYAARVMSAVVVELDGRALRLEPAGATFPAVNDFRRGEGTIQLRAAAALPAQRDGDHQLAFRNMNQREGSVYLANALVPKSDRVTIAAQRRDPAQRDLTIDYVLRGESASWPSALLLGGMAGVVLLLGVECARQRRHVR